MVQLSLAPFSLFLAMLHTAAITPPTLPHVFNCFLSSLTVVSWFFSRLHACLLVNMPVLFQSVLEELASHEVHLSRLREKAQLLWDEHAAGKGFVHSVSQLSAQYLALTNLTKVR